MNRQTLCWDCAKACGLCPWSDHWEHRPVRGWIAEKTDLRINNGRRCESYLVLQCPMFEPDEKNKRDCGEI